VFGFYNLKKARNAPCFLRFSDYKTRIGERLIFSPYKKGKTQFEF